MTDCPGCLAGRMMAILKCSNCGIELAGQAELDITRLRERVAELEDALDDLHGQVRYFCETQGEADFETAKAIAALEKKP